MKHRTHVIEKMAPNDFGPARHHPAPALCASRMGHLNAVNFNYIIRTGDVHTTSFPIIGDKANFFIDWKSDDAFTRALKTIENRSAERIQSLGLPSKLLKKRPLGQGRIVESGRR